MTLMVAQDRQRATQASQAWPSLMDSFTEESLYVDDSNVGHTLHWPSIILGQCDCVCAGTHGTHSTHMRAVNYFAKPPERSPDVCAVEGASGCVQLRGRVGHMVQAVITTA